MPSRPAGVSHDHRAAPGAGGRPHHLASVIHHFLSDAEQVEGSAVQERSRVIVTGHACSDLVALTGRALGATDGAGERIVFDESVLTYVEGLVRLGGAVLVRPADLVWCLTAGKAASLAGAQLLGRWIRCLECRRVDILVADDRGTQGKSEPGALRRLAGLVAPGVAVGVTVLGAGRWENACADLARRLDHHTESGSP